MYSGKTKNKNWKNSIPLFSFVSILVISFMLSGSAMLPQKKLNDDISTAIKNIRVSGNFSNAELWHVLKRLSAENNIRIYSEAELEGRISAALFNTPLDEALSKMLAGLGYTHEYKQDGILIARNSNAQGSPAAGPALKKSYIAPSFISVMKVKEIIERYRSETAVVSYDEKNNSLLLEEKPEISDIITRKIREIDRVSSNSGAGEPDGALQETRLFSLKNSKVSDLLPELQKLLARNDSAFPNENLNSVIVTASSDKIAEIEKLVSGFELCDAVATVNFKIMEVPVEIAAELSRIGYNLETDGKSGVKFSKIKNKDYFYGITGKFMRFSDGLACDNGGFVEINGRYHSINSKLIIKPAINKNGSFKLKAEAREEISAEIFHKNAEASVFNSRGFEADLKESDLVIVSGFEKSVADAVAMSAFFEELSFVPGLGKMAAAAKKIAASDNPDLLEGGTVIVVAIEVSAKKSGKGMAKYSFINLARISEMRPRAEDAAVNTDFAAECMYNGSSGTAVREMPVQETINGGVITEDTSACIKKTVAVKSAPEKKFMDGDEKMPEEKDEEQIAIEKTKKYMQKAQYKKARDAAREYLEKSPESVEMRVVLGNALKELKNFVSAKKEWEIALEAAPENEGLKENVEKMDKLISLIRSEKEKLGNKESAAELEKYLR